MATKYYRSKSTKIDIDLSKECLTYCAGEILPKSFKGQAEVELPSGEFVQVKGGNPVPLDAVGCLIYDKKRNRMHFSANDVYNAVQEQFCGVMSCLKT